jgi:predicted DNA-binding transcriptional regulator AlpA
MTAVTPAVLRPKQGAAYLSVSLPTFWGLAKKDPTFPKLFKIGPNSTAVMRRDLDAWLESKRGAQ